MNIQSRIESTPVVDITTRLDTLATDEVHQQGFAGTIRTKQTPVLSARDFEPIDLEYGTPTDAAESLLDDEKRNHEWFGFNCSSRRCCHSINSFTESFSTAIAFAQLTQ